MQAFDRDWDSFVVHVQFNAASEMLGKIQL